MSTGSSKVEVQEACLPGIVCDVDRVVAPVNMRRKAISNQADVWAVLAYALFHPPSDGF